jgi:hypothetical protein
VHCHPHSTLLPLERLQHSNPSNTHNEGGLGIVGHIIAGLASSRLLQP